MTAGRHIITRMTTNEKKNNNKTIPGLNATLAAGTFRARVRTLRGLKIWSRDHPTEPIRKL